MVRGDEEQRARIEERRGGEGRIVTDEERRDGVSKRAEQKQS